MRRAALDARGLATYVEDNLRLASARAVPEVRLWQAGPGSRLRHVVGAGAPYWAYQWAGGTVLARYLLDTPARVAGRRVLDLGCGGGLVAIAAAKAGASRVRAVDVDAAAVAVVPLNAAANEVAVEASLADLLDGPPPDADVVLVGDLFYAPELAVRVIACLVRCRQAGMQVLIGDPYRAHLPVARLCCLIEMEVPDFGGGAVRAGVFEVSVV